MKKADYTSTQKSLHWLSAAIIMWALASGFYVALFSVSDATKEQISFINVSVTTLFIPFFIFRTYLALRRHFAMPKQALSGEQRVVVFVHWLLYTVIAMVMITGVLMMDRAINVFGWFFIPQPLHSAYWIQQFTTLHVASCVLLALLVALHISAVIKHELCGRRIILNMWFHK